MLLTGNICRLCYQRLVVASNKHFTKKHAVFNRPESSIVHLSRLFTTSPPRLKRASKSAFSENLLQLRYLYAHTSLGRWEDVPDGILLDVGYGDSMPDKTWNPATPTILALHSSPGSHESLEPIVQPFVKMGCRVIAPNFPGFGFTEGISAAFSDVFNHSTDEKAEFLRDFLAAFGVESVDLVIGHGAACYPLLRLATTIDTTNMFKSAVIISPWPHKEFRGIQPIMIHKMVSYLWDRPFLRTLCRMASVAAKQSLGLKGARLADVVTTCRTIAALEFDEIAGGLVAADIISFPIVTLHSADDPHISEELYKEFSDLLGIYDDHVTLVGEDGKIMKQAEVEGFPKCFRFEKGGHDPHLRYPGLLNAISWDLLKHVRPDIR